MAGYRPGAGRGREVRARARRRLHHRRRAGLGRGRRRRGAPGPRARAGGRRRRVRPNAHPAAERGVTVRAVEVHADGTRLADLLARTAAGELPARVHAVVPLDRVADAHRAAAEGGVRGRYVLRP
ncbi:zinc-binding dehydrogenase [Micromonospora chalcea]|uniref:zinc-binding dehydrogenase n=1 Tax=Micromonospora chalcea TaxID=1874 RepID=UPI001FC8F2AE|nr:zinc-binding dehydrogenase [Micromonospora chalcea]